MHERLACWWRCGRDLDLVGASFSDPYSLGNAHSFLHPPSCSYRHSHSNYYANLDTNPHFNPHLNPHPRPHA